MARALAGVGEASIEALLGPTNTGKTHRAVERMLEHDSGIIGLPLRLLAREVYDRVSAQVGEDLVALVTGEEKRVPRRPRYWVCTTESMPGQLDVDFVAVDEVQLAAHHERGHVFTDRLLHARGRRETWFLGAPTVTDLLQRLLPTVQLRRHPRLSNLRYRGRSSLGSLPARSAVVAFNAMQVYEIADRLRRRRGGAAVVLGALSPRARNAQVALYQAGEVDYLVATDAIGMGLNLDVDHVALAGVSKFDGREARGLDAAEIAQIVGRAGRYVRDGTFGVLAPQPELPAPLVSRLHAHRFDPVRKAYWRNPHLDYGSVDALLGSLARRPRGSHLKSVPHADDVEALKLLASRPEIQSRARGEHAIELLWDVCRVPDYGKVLPEQHSALLARIYVQLLDRGRLEQDWLESEVRRVERPAGDIHTLMARIRAVRTWTYVANQSDWVSRAGAWRQRTRDIEDRLSDALHARLVQRFVGEAKRGRRRSRRRERARDAEGVSAGDSPFAQLMHLQVAGGAPGSCPAADLAQGIVDADFEAFSLAADATISYGGKVIARLRRGATLLRPEVIVTRPDSSSAAEHLRVTRRMQAWSRDLVTRLLAPLPEQQAVAGAAARGLLYQLEQGLGTALRGPAESQVAELDPSDRRALLEAGVVLGRYSVFSQPMLRSPFVTWRLALCHAYHGSSPQLPRSSEQPPSFACRSGADPELHLLIGYPVVAGRAVRCDVLEELSRLLSGPGPDHAAAAERLGASKRQLAHVAAALGAGAQRAPRRRRRGRSRSRKSP